MNVTLASLCTHACPCVFIISCSVLVYSWQALLIVLLHAMVLFRNGSLAIQFSRLPALLWYLKVCCCATFVCWGFGGMCFCFCQCITTIICYAFLCSSFFPLSYHLLGEDLDFKVRIFFCLLLFKIVLWQITMLMLLFAS